jgi:hypothetical protein
VRVPRGSVCLVAVVSAWRSVCAHVCVCVHVCAWLLPRLLSATDAVGCCNPLCRRFDECYSTSASRLTTPTRR